MAKDPAFLFYPGDWLTPNTYDTNFSYPTNKPGVYLISITDIDMVKKSINYNIVYAGSAKNLSIRYNRHEVLRFLKLNHPYVQFYFKETDDYKEIEKKLIRIIQPKYNKQWR
jgi:hypothetical protein